MGGRRGPLRPGAAVPGAGRRPPPLPPLPCGPDPPLPCGRPVATIPGRMPMLPPWGIGGRMPWPWPWPGPAMRIMPGGPPVGPRGPPGPPGRIAPIGPGAFGRICIMGLPPMFIMGLPMPPMLMGMPGRTMGTPMPPIGSGMPMPIMGLPPPIGTRPPVVLRVSPRRCWACSARMVRPSSSCVCQGGTEGGRNRQDQKKREVSAHR